MNNSKRRCMFACIIATIYLVAVPQQSHAASKHKHQTDTSAKERLVLMPLRVPDEDKNLIGAMATALVKGLQQKYDVFSGEQVSQKAHEIFMKENRNTAHNECDETKCMQNIAMAFQAELIATANVTKQDGIYYLALSIQNIFDNKVVYSESLPCENCNGAQVVEKLKVLSGTVATAAPALEEPQAKVNLSDPEIALWEEAKKGNEVEDYQAYLTQYPKGKYVALAKTKLKKLKVDALAAAKQQDQQAWDEAQQDNTQGSYARYFDAYPKGQFAALAQARIVKIKREASEAEAKQKRIAAATPKGFISQGSLMWMPISFTKNWADANAYCTNSVINGQTGWRLPTINELRAFFESGAVAAQVGKLIVAWTSAPHSAGRHIGVDLDYLGVSDVFDAANVYVTCVHGIKAATMPKGFISQGSLTWMPVKVNSSKAWPEANAYCANTTINGQNGWRLPTNVELVGLYDSGAMKKQGWALGNTWSSTGANMRSHWFVNLNSNYAAFSEDNSLLEVTCVR